MSGYASVFLLILAGLSGIASAQPDPQRHEEQQRAAIIDACVKEIRSQLKPGQTLTNQQRMEAEAKCRTKADDIMQTKKNAPKQ